MAKDTGRMEQAEKQDIFDKMMKWPILRIFEPFYKKYKEVLLYLFFGVLCTVVSISVYWYFNVALGINALIANIISWIAAVTFAYCTNRTWVFQSKKTGFEEIVKEMLSFFSGRLVTLGMEEMILLVFITLLHFNSMVVKIAAQFVVVVMNYVISKLFIFKKER